MPVTAYGAVRRRCSGGTVRAPDDGLAGRTIQPALKHIEFALPAHSCVKQTPQICNGAMRWSNIAEMCALFGPDPLGLRSGHTAPGTSVVRLDVVVVVKALDSDRCSLPLHHYATRGAVV